MVLTGHQRKQQKDVGCAVTSMCLSSLFLHYIIVVKPPLMLVWRHTRCVTMLRQQGLVLRYAFQNLSEMSMPICCRDS